MKTLTTIQDKKTIPSPFQAAAQVENPVTASAMKSVTSLNKAPLADVMSHPKKVETVLSATKTGKRGGGRKPSRQALVDTEFRLEAPLAGSVKLAADFTEWEKFPRDMTKSEKGSWHAVIPLPPGDHPYRFIVDGQWCDDPHPAFCVANPFGTTNAVVKVI